MEEDARKQFEDLAETLNEDRPKKECLKKEKKHSTAWNLFLSDYIKFQIQPE